MSVALTIPPGLYQSIIKTAKNIGDLTILASPTQHDDYPQRIPPSIPILHLGPPPDLLTALSKDGIPGNVLERLALSFEKFVRKLQEHFVDEFQQACNKLAVLPRQDAFLPLPRLLEQLRATFKLMYDSKVKEWVTDVRKAVKSRATTCSVMGPASTLVGTNNKSAPVAVCDRKRFNVDYIPILEEYYKVQQFPPRADKVALAKKSGMSYRQIHVWFQNRRSRSKRTGTSELCRPEAQPDIPKIVVNRQSGSRIGLHHVVGEGNARSTSIVPVEVSTFLSASPQHAFPAAYPPIWSEDPFPCRSGDFSKFQKLKWDRSPATRQFSHSELDVSSLVSSFAKLSMGGTGRPASAEGNCLPWGLRAPTEKSGCDVTLPYTVRPLRAPMTSLVNTPVMPKHLEIGVRTRGSSLVADTPRAKILQSVSRGCSQHLSPVTRMSESQKNHNDTSIFKAHVYPESLTSPASASTHTHTPALLKRATIGSAFESPARLKKEINDKTRPSCPDYDLG